MPHPKRGRVLALSLPFVLVAMAGCAPAPPKSIPAAQITRVIPNAGFEESAEGWTCEPPQSGWQRYLGIARNGYASMTLKAGDAGSQFRLISDPLPAQQGDCVFFNAWVRVVGKTQTQPRVTAEALLDDEWHVVAPESEAPMLRAYYADEWEWSPRGSSVVLPEGTKAARIAVTLEPEADVEWYVDDVTCRVVSLAAYAEKNRTSERLTDLVLAVPDAQAQGYVGCYGGLARTPHIDALAAEGRRYVKATTASPWTKPSFASVFTSLYPSQHRAELIDSPLREDLPTLAEALQSKGYFTAGFVRAPYDGFIGPGMGFDQGFDVYFYYDDEDLAFEAMEAFLKTNLDRIKGLKNGGLFLFWHFYEPHAPYRNHAPDRIINEGVAGPGPFNELSIEATILSGDSTKGNEKDIAYVRSCYASENELVDARLGVLLDLLREAGVYEKAAILYCSDHGESFGEKPGVWNHHHPYITCTQIPFILRFPGRIPPGETDRETMVSNLDIMPTLLALTGVARPHGCEGRDLLSEAAGRTAEEGISEDLQNGSICIRDGRYKLVLNKASVWNGQDDWRSAHWVLFDVGGPTSCELYDLEVDPLELTNIRDQRPEEFQRLKNALYQHCERTGIRDSAALPPREAPGISEEGMAEIGAMGYLGGNTSP